MGFSTILVATDFSEPAGVAVEAAAQLAQAAGAKLLVHHVSAPLPSRSLGREAARQIREEQTEQLEAIARDVAARFEGVEVEASVGSGDLVGGVICDQAARVEADLVVVSSMGKTGLDRLALGSVAEHVVRRAPCPVWVARGSQLPRRVQACTDLSPAAAEALDLAGEVLGITDGHIELLHVLTDTSGMAAETARTLATTREAELATLAQQHIPSREARTSVLTGASEADAIVAHAERTSADLLVLATRGRSGLARMVLGSVAELVVRRAPCSVLVAHRPHD